MSKIFVQKTAGETFSVEVKDKTSEATFQVSIPKNIKEKWVQEKGVTEENLIIASFRFLLDREPKESILSSFDLNVISRYFPDYERKLSEYLNSN